jgi:hypothetical protein
MKAVVDKLLFYPTVGEPFDITGMVTEINLFQSLTDHYMYCELVLLDSVGISRTIPQDIDSKINGGITGGEIIVIQYYSDSNPEKIHSFMLYERSNRSRTQDNMEVYILHGISVEAFETYGRKISRSYGGDNGKLIRDMMKSVFNQYVVSSNVKDIYEEIRQTSKSSIEKQLITDDEDTGLHKFIIPNLSVDETIDFMCNEADTKDHIPYYFFFENSYGYFFLNLGYMVQATPVMEYVYSEYNVGEESGQKRIMSYEVNNEINILENARAGLFKSKTINIDVLSKRKTETIFDYSKRSGDFKKLQPLIHKGDAPEDVNVTMMTSRTGHDGNPLFALEKHKPKKLNTFLGARRSYSTSIFSNSLTVSVQGTTLLDVGSTVTLQFPLKDAMADGQEVVLDKDLSGKYIITKVRNKIEDPQGDAMFVTIFECVKDTQIMES